MPFRRTSIDSSQRTGFYSPKQSRVVGSRIINEPPVSNDYWSDMAVQMFGWESLAYIEWWGN